jgi:RNA polymerase subunit RPABC4/transcription elongation factor Spt4
MPQLPTELLNTIGVVLELIVAAMTALLVAFWIGLVVWTFRDIRARTRDVFAWLLATVLVLILGPIGWLLYFLLRPRETLAQVYDRQLEEEVLLRDITVRHACPKCQAVTEAEWLLCPHCGVELRQKCADCGRPLNLDWIACPYCTAPVANAKGRGKLRAAAPQPVASPVVYTPEPAVDAGPMPQPSFEPRPAPATE